MQKVKYMPDENKKEFLQVINPANGIIFDFCEMGIDKILTLVLENSNALEDIPIVKYLVATLKISSNIQTAFFAKKYSVFIKIMKGQVTDKQMDQLANDLARDGKKLNKIIENILIDIDRYHTEEKSKYLAILFVKTFIDKRFSQEEYNKIRFSIDLMHPYDGAIILKRFYENHKEYAKYSKNDPQHNRDVIETERQGIDFSSLAMSGFIRLPTGGAMSGDVGGASISQLGIKFYEEVLANEM